MQSETTRRAFLVGGAGLAGSLLASTVLADEPAGLKSRFLCSVNVEFGPSHPVGKVSDGSELTIYSVAGGTVEGPRISGTILPGPADWFRQRADGVGVLDVRGTFRADDDSLVYIHYAGYAHHQTPDESLYFRTQPRFETASVKYGWLNRILTVGVGPAQLPEDELAYDIYEIL